MGTLISKIMRKLLLLIAITFFISSCKSDSSFSLSGNISNSEDKLIYLSTRDNGKLISIDSTMIINGRFQFTGNVDYPAPFYLRVDGKRGYKMLFIENGSITVTGSADSLYALIVSGSNTDAEYEIYNSVLEDLYDKKRELFFAQKNSKDLMDTVSLSQIEKELAEINRDIRSWKQEFIRNYRESYAAPLILRSLSSEISADSMETLIGQLDPGVRETGMALELIETVKRSRTLVPGNKAPAFSLSDINEDIVSLEELSDKGAVLLQFWTSWSAPCREINRELAEKLKIYQGKGLSIIGVSLDSDRDEWKRAIIEDGIEWIQLSDPQAWNSELALKYNVEKIPSNFLIDSDGLIVGSDMSPDEIDLALSGLFGR